MRKEERSICVGNPKAVVPNFRSRPKLGSRGGGGVYGELENYEKKSKFAEFICPVHYKFIPF
jgi:hypothetical protein